MSSILFKYFILLFLISSQLLHSTERGTIYIIHGTTCSGKSTLAKQLVKKIPNSIKVESAPLVKKMRLDTLESLTGKRPQNGREMTEAVLAIPPDKIRNYTGIRKKALLITNEKVKRLASQGNNVIYDSTDKTPERLNAFRNEKTLSILVYTPLPTLIERADKRKRKYVRNEMLRQRTLNTILVGFLKVYKPTSLNDENSIDILTREEIMHLFASPFKKYAYPDLQNTLSLFLDHFNLNQHSAVRIASRIPYDIVIDTTKEDSSEIL